MTSLIFLFGPPGVGKSYIGNLLKAHRQYFFYDADEDLTPAMIQCIREEQPFGQALRDEYVAIVTHKIVNLKEKHKKLVVAQALAKEVNREFLQNQHPEARFVLVQAEKAAMDLRLEQRNDWVSVGYAEKIRHIFELPRLAHQVLDNNYVGDQALLNQLQDILP